MAQDAIKNLMGNRDAIRKLMAMDANGQMDKIMENAKNNGSFVMNEEGGSYTPSPNRNVNQSPVVVNEQIIAKHAHMPKAVLESFRNNPGQEMSTSVLGDINLPPVTQKPTQIQEQQQPVSNSPIIDYSLIKTIINEAVQENVKKYMGVLSKKLLSEGVNKNINDDSNTVQAIKLGDKFSFITKNGDIYEGKLTFKRNINDAK